MPYCEKCGAKIEEKADFCSNCGEIIDKSKIKSQPRDECFGKRKEQDLIGLVSLGFFLIILAYLFISYPWIPTDFMDWITNLGEGVFKPSLRLIDVFSLFIFLLAVSNLITAAIRVALKQKWKMPFKDVLSAIFLFSFAYFIQLYAQDLIPWQNTLIYSVIILGLLIIMYGLIVYMIEKS